MAITTLQQSRRPGRPGKPGVLFGQWAFGPEGRVTRAVAEQERRAAEIVTVQQRARDAVTYEDLIKRGPDTCVNVEGRAYGLGQITPPVVIVSYTVPEAFVFKLNAVGMQFSDPIFMQLDPTVRLPWRIEIDEVPLPQVSDGGDSFAISPGSHFEPFELDKCWCQGGQTVRVACRPFTITIEVNAVARIRGELYKAAGLELTGERV